MSNQRQEVRPAMEGLTLIQRAILRALVAIDYVRLGKRRFIVRGPNVQGWACILLFSIWSYESSSLWPIIGFVGFSLLCGVVAWSCHR